MTGRSLREPATAPLHAPDYAGAGNPIFFTNGSQPQAWRSNQRASAVAWRSKSMPAPVPRKPACRRRHAARRAGPRTVLGTPPVPVVQLENVPGNCTAKISRGRTFPTTRIGRYLVNCAVMRTRAACACLDRGPQLPRRIDRRDRTGARLDRFARLRGRVLAKARADDLHAHRQAVGEPVGTATAGNPSTGTAIMVAHSRHSAAVRAALSMSKPCS